MADTTYRILEGGMHDRFHKSRGTIQFIGGGYGNGKTACVCVKGLRLARDYPGSNGLIARATYPRLNDTIRKEFQKWCPNDWVKRRPTKDDNSLYLTNGTIVNFRYLSQRGKETEEAKSNLLSATYDWIIVDQLEDPEISHKDFLDLVGRLRGGTEYAWRACDEQFDPTMPKLGPRWMMLTTNPTRNWVYRKLIRPLHRWQVGQRDPDLLVRLDATGAPVLTDGQPTPLIELFEGSTHENVHNVGSDFIANMLSAYQPGSAMAKRFVGGEWGALEGLVYPHFAEDMHIIRSDDLREHLRQLRLSGYNPTVIEGYDHGIAKPACYGLFFADDDGNVFLLDGFYEKEASLEQLGTWIRHYRDKHDLTNLVREPVYADPQIFKRASGGKRVVGRSVSEMFDEDEGVTMQPGNNNIYGGIAKVAGYLAPSLNHQHPMTDNRPAPHFYVSDECQWWINEVVEYVWQRDDEYEDKPVDRNDHAMDMTKYALSNRPAVAKFVGKPDAPPAWMAWHDAETTTRTRLPRHK